MQGSACSTLIGRLYQVERGQGGHMLASQFLKHKQRYTLSIRDVYDM